MNKQLSMRWKAGDTIREKKTGKPFLVLHVYKNTATILSDLESDMPLAIVLLPRKYDEFASESEMRQEVEEDEYGNFNSTWHYEQLPQL